MHMAWTGLRHEKWICCLAIYNYAIHIQIYAEAKSKINIRTSMNERTHFLIKMYPSHFILERVAKGLTLVMCERWVGDGDRLSPKVLLTMAALLSLPVWVVQPWVTEGRKPSVCELILTLASCPQLTPTATGTRTESLKLSLASAYIIVW